MSCLLLAGPAGQEVWQNQNQLLHWFETGLAGERCHAQGFGLGDFAVRCSQVAPQSFSLHISVWFCEDFVSKSTLLSLC